MTQSINNWYQNNQSLFNNTLSLVAATGMVSGLGFLFWWLAARLFDPESVGLVSAATSSMILFGTIGILGLDHFLISHISSKGSSKPIISTSLWLSATVSFGLGLTFAIISIILKTELSSFFSDPIRTFFFALGVALTSLTTIIDKALIGYLWGYAQLWRNFIFSASKIVLLFPVAWFYSQNSDLGMMVAWVAGSILSLFILLILTLNRGVNFPYLPKWHLLRNLGSSISGHYFLNLGQAVPTLAMPVIVLIAYGSELNAAFYVAWMFIMVAKVIPQHLTTVLHAVGSRNIELLKSKLKVTLNLSLLISLAIILFIWLFGDYLLSIFGDIYKTNAAMSLKILSLSILPNIVCIHYMALARIENFVQHAALIYIGLGTFELITATVVANLASLETMSWALVAVVFIQASVLGPSLWKRLQ